MYTCAHLGRSEAAHDVVDGEEAHGRNEALLAACHLALLRVECIPLRGQNVALVAASRLEFLGAAVFPSCQIERRLLSEILAVPLPRTIVELRRLEGRPCSEVCDVVTRHVASACSCLGARLIKSTRRLLWWWLTRQRKHTPLCLWHDDVLLVERVGRTEEVPLCHPAIVRR